MSILGSEEGVTRAASENGGDGLHVVIGAVDKELGGENGGMIIPGYLNISLSLPTDSALF